MKNKQVKVIIPFDEYQRLLDIEEEKEKQENIFNFDNDEYRKLRDENKMLQELLENLFIDEEITIVNSMNKIITELKTDEGYFQAWKANIAMQFKDLFKYNVLSYNNVSISCNTPEGIHKLANQAANNFLKLLISQNETKSGLSKGEATCIERDNN